MLEPDGRIERRLRDAGFGLVAGVDETGRGALAGPLVACAVILPHDAELPGLRDSKLLTPLARARLCSQIQHQAVAISLVRVPSTSIDRRGLHRSNLRALREAAMRLRPAPEYLLVDGFPVRRVHQIAALEITHPKSCAELHAAVPDGSGRRARARCDEE